MSPASLWWVLSVRCLRSGARRQQLASCAACARSAPDQAPAVRPGPCQVTLMLGKPLAEVSPAHELQEQALQTPFSEQTPYLLPILVFHSSARSATALLHQAASALHECACAGTRRWRCRNFWRSCTRGPGTASCAAACPSLPLCALPWCRSSNMQEDVLSLRSLTPEITNREAVTGTASCAAACPSLQPRALASRLCRLVQTTLSAEGPSFSSTACHLGP